MRALEIIGKVGAVIGIPFVWPFYILSYLLWKYGDDADSWEMAGLIVMIIIATSVQLWWIVYLVSFGVPA